MFDQLFSSYSFPFDSYLSPTEERKRKSEQNDYEYARELQRQEYERYKVLRKQFELERSAESLGVLAKKQVVQYNNKSTGTKHKAFIIDTHLDDGPDKPYYVSALSIDMFPSRFSVSLSHNRKFFSSITKDNKISKSTDCHR